MALRAIKSGIVYAAVGAGVGFGIGMFRGAGGSASAAGYAGWIEPYMHLRDDADAVSTCEELMLVRNRAPAAFDAFVVSLDKLLAIRAKAADTSAALRPAYPAAAARYRTKAVDALRSLEDALDPEDADVREALAAAQKLMNDAVFNVSMDVQSRLDT